MLERRDDVFWVWEGRRYGDPAAAGSPVHARSLTAIYFPGALRSGR